MKTGRGSLTIGVEIDRGSVVLIPRRINSA